ncbi:Uncharacterised protein [Mycobacteroides abscessus subsp. abscessus]|nr:Uncharacterised protein [Mycobacteroides abscessus subsp. abscessus]
MLVPRHPAAVEVDQLAHGVQEDRFGQRRHAHPFRRTRHPRRVHLRTEQADGVVVEAVGLEAFEDLLRVVQHRRGRMHGDRAGGNDPVIVPAAALLPVDQHHVVGEVRPETRIGHDLGQLRLGHRRGIGRDRECACRGMCHGDRLVCRVTATRARSSTDRPEFRQRRPLGRVDKSDRRPNGVPTLVSQCPGRVTWAPS